MSRKLKQKI